MADRVVVREASWAEIEESWEPLVLGAFHPDYLGIGELSSGIEAAEAKVQSLRRRSARPGVRVWAALQRKRLVGMLVAEALDGVLQVDDLFVDAARQRRGIGRKLLEAAIAGGGCGRVAAEVNQRNAASQALFRALGFQPRLGVDWMQLDTAPPAEARPASQRLRELLPPDWRAVLADEIAKPYFEKLEDFLEHEWATQTVYPPREQLFAAFRETPYESVKVLVLGQDPYHGAGQAHGLAFSVPAGVRLPPSLRNIFKELEADLGTGAPKSGDLSAWARQGVLLLNAVLTVRAGAPTSHKSRGWETFTDAVIRKLDAKSPGIVFVLWGAYAKQKRTLVDEARHVLIEGVHPSPMSAKSGFFGSRPFSRIDAALERLGHEPVRWAS
jgi:uracil-DNA glycosylase